LSPRQGKFIAPKQPVTPMAAAPPTTTTDFDELELTLEDVAHQKAQRAELEALQAQLESTSDEAPDTSGDDEEEDDDLLGDTDALLAAATAAAAKARAAAEQAKGVDVSQSAAKAQSTLASARTSALTAATGVAETRRQQEDQLKTSSSSAKRSGADAGEEEESESDGDDDSAPRQSVLSNANWDERLRAEREKEVMEILTPIVEHDAEKMSFFRQASKMFRSGSVTAQQFMVALTKLFGGSTARRIIPLLADAVPDAARRAELHDAFRAAEREAAVARAASLSTASAPAAKQSAPAGPSRAATVLVTSAHASQSAPQQLMFSVPTSSTAAASTPISFGSPAPTSAKTQQDPSARGALPKPAPSAARQALFADDEEPSCAPAASSTQVDDMDEAAMALPTTAVGGGAVAFDPLSAPVAMPAAPAVASIDPLAIPPAVPELKAAADPLATAAPPATSGTAVSAFASAQVEGRADANGVGTHGSAEGSLSPSVAAGGGSGGVFSGLFAAPAHLREGIAVEGDVHEEQGSIVASCPHDGGQLTVAMWDTMSQSDDSGRSFTLYALRCTWVRENRRIQWLVGRRYSEFELLRSSLSGTLQHHPQFAGRIMPPLPGKTLFGGNSDAVVAERRTKLAVFLSQLFQTFPIVLRTTEMDSFLKITPRIGAIVNEFLEREVPQAGAHAALSPQPAPAVGIPPCAEYFLRLRAPTVLNLEHLGRHAVRLCTVFKAMVQRPALLNGQPPSRDANLQETARAAEVAQRCLEASAAAATDGSQQEALQLGEATIDTYLTRVLECQDRLHWCAAELASLQQTAVAAGAT